MAFPTIAAFASLAGHLPHPLVVVDVGCRWGLTGPWDAFGDRLVVYGFDPDAEECRRLAAEAGRGVSRHFVPLALGSSNRRALLHITSDPACSSLYAPDASVTAGRPALDCAREVGTSGVELVRLDDWAVEAGVAPDFMKLDTQGSELGVLEGGARILTGLCALEVEVEFNPIYVGQPLFGDVDRFLRDQGFQLWRLANLVHYGLPGLTSETGRQDVHHFDSRAVSIPSQGGQLFWGHAYYVRGHAQISGWHAHLTSACIAASIDFPDLAVHHLMEAARDAPPDVGRAIAETLRSAG